jgi:hypothetical protein
VSTGCRAFIFYIALHQRSAYDNQDIRFQQDVPQEKQAKVLAQVQPVQEEDSASSRKGRCS